MKKHFILTALLFIGVSLQAQTGQIQLNVSGLTPEWGGILRIGLYEKEYFPVHGKGIRNEAIPVRTLEKSLVLENVSPGVYAIAIFQDLNSDGKLNRTIYREPTEPYAFSNNKKGRFGPPKFDKVSFIVKSGETVPVDIYLD